MFITWLFYLYNCTKLRLNKIDVSDCQVSVGYVALSFLLLYDNCCLNFVFRSIPVLGRPCVTSVLVSL